MHRTKETHERIRAEIAREKAATLGRAGERLEQALAVVAGLEAAGHEAWVFGPRFAGAPESRPRVVRYPSIPAMTYPEFALAVPYSRRIARRVAAARTTCASSTPSASSRCPPPRSRGSTAPQAPRAS